MSERSDQSPGGCRERWDDEIAAYALDALGPEESAEVERHLAECAACSERLRWLQPAVDLVPASVPQLQPRPELKRNLMAIVHEEAAAEGAQPEPAAEAPRRRRFLRMPRPALRPAIAGLAALAVLAAGVVGYELGLGDDGEQSRTFAVQPISPKLEASGTIEVSGTSATLSIDDLPQLAEDEVYQAWIGQGGELLPSSVFVARSGGRATAAIPGLPENADRVVITREPQGGSDVATTAPLLSAELNGEPIAGDASSAQRA